MFGISLPLLPEHPGVEMGFGLVSVGSSMALWKWPCIDTILSSESRSLTFHRSLLYIFFERLKEFFSLLFLDLQ